MENDSPQVIRANEAEFHYLERGTGTPVIFVHGGLVDYRRWIPQIEAFSQQHRVITYSRRYNFPNRNAVGSANYSAIVDADDLAGILRERNLGRRHIIGESYGAYAEILNEPDPRTGGRLYWGAPVSLESRAPRYRIYGSSGYFSRGAFISSGGVEVPLTPRLIVTGALVHVRSLKDNFVADLLGLSKTRIDLAGAAVYALTPAILTVGGVGRTISAPADLGISLALNGGVSIRVTGWTKP